MKWLDSLKKETECYPDDAILFDSDEFRRLIEIAERNAKPFYVDTGYWRCLSCGADVETSDERLSRRYGVGIYTEDKQAAAWNLIEHSEDCPYSDEH